MASIDPRLVSALKTLGLSENEASVYVACLSLGPSRIRDLALASGLKRTTVYSVVQGLLEEGVLLRELRGLKTVFSALNPQALEVVYSRRLDEFRNALPRLCSLYNLKGDARAVFHYEGPQAVRNLYEELLAASKPGDFYCAMTDYDTWLEFDSKFLDSFVKRRSRKGLDLRILFRDSASARAAAQSVERGVERIRFLPSDTILSTNLIVTPELAVIHQISAPVMAIGYATRSLISMQKQIFDMLWKNALL